MVDNARMAKEDAPRGRAGVSAGLYFCAPALGVANAIRYLDP